MGSILIERFKNMDFTKGQSRIAQYMIDHEFALCRMSLMEVSKAAGVSDASVLRFVRHIGFDGYNDFKEQMYQKLTEQAALSAGNGKPRLRDRIDNEKVTDRELQLREAAVRFAQSAELSLTQNLPQTFEDIAESISGARMIYVCGARGTLAVAEHFDRCLRFMFGNTVFLPSGHDIHAALSSSGSRDLLIFFCASRFYESDVHICEAARVSDTPLCLITNSIPSPVTPFAKYTLVSKAVETTYFNSAVGMISLAEYLLDVLSQKQGKSFRNRLDSFDHFTQDERCH